MKGVIGLPMIANWNGHLLFSGHIWNGIESDVFRTSVNEVCDLWMRVKWFEEMEVSDNGSCRNFGEMSPFRAVAYAWFHRYRH